MNPTPTRSTIDATLYDLARDATVAGLRTSDPHAAEALNALARALSALAEQARAGRLLITARGPTIAADPMHEGSPARVSGATPAIVGDERLYARERGAR